MLNSFRVPSFFDWTQLEVICDALYLSNMQLIIMHAAAAAPSCTAVRRGKLLAFLCPYSFEPRLRYYRRARGTEALFSSSCWTPKSVIGCTVTNIVSALDLCHDCDPPPSSPRSVILLYVLRHKGPRQALTAAVQIFTWFISTFLHSQSPAWGPRIPYTREYQPQVRHSFSQIERSSAPPPYSGKQRRAHNECVRGEWEERVFYGSSPLICHLDSIANDK